MADDARISTALPHHPKTVKLQRRLGASGCWALVCLFLWVAENRPEGDLEGMTAEDIEIAANWSGTAGDFVRALEELRFLDREQTEYKVHDWAEHNPWAATRPQRREAAKKAAAARWERMQPASGPDTHRMRDAFKPHQTAMPSSPLLSAPHKEKTISSNSDDFDHLLQSLFDYYLEKTDRNPKTYAFTDNRKKKGRARLRECLEKTGGDIANAISLMKVAIDGLVASDWHMGRDPKTNGTHYYEWEKHLFKSYEQMERWWNAVPATPSKPNGHGVGVQA